MCKTTTDQKSISKIDFFALIILAIVSFSPQSFVNVVNTEPRRIIKYPVIKGLTLAIAIVVGSRRTLAGLCIILVFHLLSLEICTQEESATNQSFSNAHATQSNDHATQSNAHATQSNDQTGPSMQNFSENSGKEIVYE